MFIKTQKRELTSVGVDIGTSTSHLVFSRLVLQRDPLSRTEKFEVTDRRIVYAGPVHLTPLLDTCRIDFDTLRCFLLEDYEKAGFKTTDVDTGAVIITGETARKENAQFIVSSLAGETGKFVAATAGPNYEAVLAAHGSGAVARSASMHNTIMNIDIGGGTSKIAVCQNGKVVATAAINVGGRLVATDSQNRIARLEDSGKAIAKELGYTLRVGEKLKEEAKEAMSTAMAHALYDAIKGTQESKLTGILMLTPPLAFSENVDQLSFSGGIAEYIYGATREDYHDLGISLAKAVSLSMKRLHIPVAESEQKIRATVIGAGMFNLQVSGSTTFLTSGLKYPLRNLMAIVPDIPGGRTVSDIVRASVQKAFQRFDLVEGTDDVILAFNDAVRPSYDNLTQFAKGVVAALPSTLSSGKPILMCFDTDVGNSVGNIMKRETGVANNILSIDEISLRDGDFIDIGEPIIEGVVVPVVVKTLVFEH